MSSHKDTRHPAVLDDLEEWREFVDRIDVLEVPVEDFLDKLVPTNESYVPGPYERFPEYFPIIDEPIRHHDLAAFLSMLVESLPSDKKVSFSAGCGQALQAPFEILEGTHHPQTTVDIGVSLPGRTLKGPAERWQQLSMAIAIEGSACCDPFDRDDLLCNAVAHSAACARNLMLAHGLLVSFVLGVYGRTCRILRFDHTCGLVSEAFDYTKRPDLLRRFFWNLVHPCLGDTVVGCDPTVHALVNADVIWAETELAAMKVTKAILIPQEGRRVDVYDDTDASTRSFILLRPLSAERRLFSRATTVWLAIEDVRGRTNNDQTDTGMSPKLVIVKEAWREIETRSESLIYQILQHADQAERFGLPKLVCGEDVGEREVALWKTSSNHHPKQEFHSYETDLASRQPLSDRSTNGGSSSAYSVSDMKGLVSSYGSSCKDTNSSSRDSKYPLPFPQHQTFSWRITGELEYAYRERSQMRLVIDVVGRPLADFRSTKQLVRAIRDVVRGHENAWKRGILHRDISEGNVLLVDEDLASLFLFTAFLHDFDYSWFASQQEDASTSTCSITTSGNKTPKLDDRVLLGQTGTPPFMAIEIHKQRTLRYLGHAVRHDVHHDLESVYWLLVWMVLRHARYLHIWGPKAERTLFGCADHTFYASMKAVWLDLPSVAVWNNAPLTRLIGQFADAVRASNPSLPDSKGVLQPVHLTHAGVLKLLDEALDSENWPEDDTALSRDEREAWRAHSAALHPGEKRAHDGLGHQELDEGVLDLAGDLKRRKT